MSLFMNLYQIHTKKKKNQEISSAGIANFSGSFSWVVKHNLTRRDRILTAITDTYHDWKWKMTQNHHQMPSFITDNE